MTLVAVAAVLAALVALLAFGHSTRRLGLLRREIAAVRSEQAATVITAPDDSAVDELTGLATRRGVDVAMIHALSRAARAGGDVGAVAVGIADFAALTHSFGRLAGDETLRVLAQRLHENVRGGETLGRADSDTFVLVLEAPVSVFGASRAATRLLTVATEPIEVDGRVMRLRAHAGVAAGREAGPTLVDDALTALARARADESGAPMLYEPTLREEATAVFRIDQQLASALAGNELSVAYQPVHRSRDLVMVGAEALLRWHSPVLGEVPPGDFIPVAESTGRIVELGAWVLRQACDDLCGLHVATRRRDLTVSVNVSVHQLTRPDFVDVVASTLQGASLDPSSLVVEITESVLAHPDAVGRQLHGLHELGVALALDDVGTGYSSLGQLSALPLDTIKLDRSIVAAPGDRADGSSKLLSGLASLGSSLGFDVVAEGVETAAHLAVARHSGCTHLQGFHLARPMPAAALAAHAALDHPSRVA